MPAHTTLADAPINVPFPKQTGGNRHEVGIYQENPTAQKLLEHHRRAMSLVYLTFSLSNPHKDVIVNLSGRTLLASIWTLDTAHFIIRCRGWRGGWWGGVEHHSSDRCGPVTTQLIKARHSDSYVTLSISLSLCVSLFLSERSWILRRSRSRCWGADHSTLQSLDKGGLGLGLPAQKAQHELSQGGRSANAQRSRPLKHVRIPSGRGHKQTDQPAAPGEPAFQTPNQIHVFRWWHRAGTSPHLRDRPPWPRRRWEVSLAGSRLRPDSDWWGLESGSRNERWKVKDWIVPSPHRERDHVCKYWGVDLCFSKSTWQNEASRTAQKVFGWGHKASQTQLSEAATFASLALLTGCSSHSQFTASSPFHFCWQVLICQTLPLISLKTKSACLNATLVSDLLELSRHAVINRVLFSY